MGVAGDSPFRDQKTEGRMDNLLAVSGTRSKRARANAVAGPGSVEDEELCLAFLSKKSMDHAEGPPEVSQLFALEGSEELRYRGLSSNPFAIPESLLATEVPNEPSVSTCTKHVIQGQNSIGYSLDRYRFMIFLYLPQSPDNQMSFHSRSREESGLSQGNGSYGNIQRVS